MSCACCKSWADLNCSLFTKISPINLQNFLLFFYFILNKAPYSHKYQNIIKLGRTWWISKFHYDSNTIRWYLNRLICNIIFLLVIFKKWHTITRVKKFCYKFQTLENLLKPCSYFLSEFSSSSFSANVFGSYSTLYQSKNNRFQFFSNFQTFCIIVFCSKPIKHHFNR